MTVLEQCLGCGRHRLGGWPDGACSDCLGRRVQLQLPVATEPGTPMHTVVTTWAWAPTLCCPRCSYRQVWTEHQASDGDVGAAHLCAGCGTMFYMPVLISPGSRHYNADTCGEILHAIRGWAPEPRA